MNSENPKTNTIRLGDYIERSMLNNKDLKYGAQLIEGVNNDGVFTSPKGSTLDIDLKPYKIVNNGAFVYNPSRLDLGSIAYRKDGLCIVSHLYVVFYLNDEGKKRIVPEWLFLYFRRKEFLREVTFRNFGSQRPEFSFYDMSEIRIPLPDYKIQQKYVNIYNALLANHKGFEHGVEDLKLVCDGYIDKLKRELPGAKIGPYLQIIDLRNEKGLSVNSVRGLSTNKEIIPTKADMNGVGLENYKVLEPGQFAYVSDTSRRGDKISLVLNNHSESYLVSSISTVFSTNRSKLLPEYLMLFFSRSEFDRYARFHSWGSARETFDWEELCDVEIPIPDITVQRAISDVYKAYLERKKISEIIEKQVNSICPVLIRGSLQEGA